MANSNTAESAATPTPTPTPTFPSTVATFTNGTGQAADHLHVSVDLAANQVPVLQNAPGCNAPTVFGASALFSDIDVIWPDPCVDPGESVVLKFFSDCIGTFCFPPRILSHFWSLLTTPTPTPSPIGGIVELRTAPSDAPQTHGDDSEPSAPLYVALVGGALVTLAAGGWYARRRWLG